MVAKSFNTLSCVWWRRIIRHVSGPWVKRSEIKFTGHLVKLTTRIRTLVALARRRKCLSCTVHFNADDIDAVIHHAFAAIILFRPNIMLIFLKTSRACNGYKQRSIHRKSWATSQLVLRKCIQRLKNKPLKHNWNRLSSQYYKSLTAPRELKAQLFRVTSLRYINYFA